MGLKDSDSCCDIHHHGWLYSPLISIERCYSHHEAFWKIYRGYKIISPAPKVYCKALEDNSGPLEITCLPKMCPQTKAINVVYQHFCEHAHLSKIAINPHCNEQSVGWCLYQAFNIKNFSPPSKTNLRLVTNASLHTVFERECENSRMFWIIPWNPKMSDSHMIAN